MSNYRHGGLTLVAGTACIVIGLILIVSPQGADRTDLDVIGSVLALGGFLLRLEAAIARRGAPPPTADTHPPRPWHRPEPDADSEG